MIFPKILLFIKNNFFNLLIAVLVLIVLLQRCGGPTPTPELPTVKKDTVWVVKQNIYITKPTLVQTIPGEPGTDFIPDPNYSKLVLQYQSLVKDYIAKNIHRDSIKIDSIGYVNIEDTVSHNLIQGRKTSYKFKYPVITNTITLPQERKNQLYFGGGLESNPMAGSMEFNVGLLLKNKKDQIFNVYGGVDTRGDYQIGLQSYWKIKLHK